MAKWGKPAGMPATSSVTTQWTVVQPTGRSQPSPATGIFVTNARNLTVRAMRRIGFSPVTAGSADTVGAGPFYTSIGSRAALVASRATVMLASLACALGGRFPANRHAARRARPFNWHFVGVDWIALLPALYVVG